MTAKEIERFRRIEEIFDDALEFPPGPERDAFFRDKEATDSGLLTEVRDLLADLDRVRAAAPELPEVLPRFGPWQAIRLLGRGGMGTVYLAERADGAFQMLAAVKVVPLALASVDIEERFRRERQFLASLDHPKIAGLIDGGITPTGLPYLVMDFVDGISIDRYCDERSLDTRARVALMRQVCEALEYVHGQQVIHRDLKPSNILVDAAGKVKLLDFGTARLVDSSGDIAITKTGVFAFTPEYASPEQVQAKPLTFASDVYSTGVLLYRLLTGRSPYQFGDHSPAAVAATIAHTEPEPSRLDKPLDAIVSKALLKNPNERYASAAAMDADLARYLDGEPVLARSSWKRRRTVIAAAVGLCAVVCVALLRAYFGHPTPTPTSSIAIIPFKDLNNNPSDQYFADGLTGEFTTELARNRALLVIDQASAFEFRKAPDIREAGRKLHVDTVLTGSVQHDETRVQVGVELRRVSDGTRLWSKSYTRQTANLYSLPAELAAGIATALHAPAAPARSVKHTVQDEEARNAYMRAMYEAEQFTPEALKKAEAGCLHAIERDPEYALAYVCLGAVTLNQILAQPRGSAGFAEAKRGTQQYYRRALELDPDLPTPRANLATLALQDDWDWKGAEREYRAALVAGPNAAANQSLGMLLVFEGRFKEADEYLRLAQEENPYSTAQIANTAQARMLERRFTQARELSQGLLARSPGMLQARLAVDAAYLGEGRPELALADYQKLDHRQYPILYVAEALALARAGRKEEALAQIRPLEATYQEGAVPMAAFAGVYAWLGDDENAVKWLERSADRHEYQILNIGVNSGYDRVRQAARFHALLLKVGLK